MWVEQAIYTSLPRAGRAGYHVVARSPGITEADARQLATWAPSQGALIVDPANRVSVNFHPLSPGRWALSRTCEGPAEYSGRGGRQLYTHALILEEAHLRRSNYQPLCLYWDALAQGLLHYQPEPPASLTTVSLGSSFPDRDPHTWINRSRDFRQIDLSRLRDALRSGEPVEVRHLGDRIALVECLLGLLPPNLVASTSFTTSLRPSPVRPYRISPGDY